MAGLDQYKFEIPVGYNSGGTPTLGYLVPPLEEMRQSADDLFAKPAKIFPTGPS